MPVEWIAPGIITVFLPQCHLLYVPTTSASYRCTTKLHFLIMSLMLHLLLWSSLKFSSFVSDHLWEAHFTSLNSVMLTLSCMVGNSSACNGHPGVTGLCVLWILWLYDHGMNLIESLPVASDSLLLLGFQGEARPVTHFWKTVPCGNVFNCTITTWTLIFPLLSHFAR